NSMGGGEYACYGRTGCQLAWICLSEHPSDVRGAKDIAANYCVDNFAECSKGATWEELGNEFLAQAAGGAIGAGVVASRIRAGAARRGVCANSFTGDTPVLMADGSTKPIDEVEVGDEVAASEPESAVVEGHVVTALHVTDADKEYVDLTVSTPEGTKVVRTTAHHPFYNASTREWTDVEQLHAGEELSTPGNGRALLTSTTRFTAKLRTYNLTIERVHTYYVLAGDTPVLVHNANCGEIVSPLMVIALLVPLHVKVRVWVTMRCHSFKNSAPGRGVSRACKAQMECGAGESISIPRTRRRAFMSTGGLRTALSVVTAGKVERMSSVGALIKITGRSCRTFHTRNR
ncbi:MAG TPA: Hint domain-containing protein, partial [Glaciihabitans sp.]|nr:Hint domain-containing protein [Glaciihabitans sp.]